MKYYGQWDPPVDKILHERYIDYSGGIFIECGAFDGLTESSCKFFEDTFQWTGINIEPVPFIYDVLCKNRPSCININTALSSSCGTKTFTYAVHPKMKLFGNGSLSHTKKHYNQLKLEGCKFEQYEVNTMTYVELIKQYSLSKVDLFVLDVEGHEMEVIKGMDGGTVMPNIMCVEYGHQDMKGVMSDLGYKLDFQKFNNSYFVRK